MSIQKIINVVTDNNCLDEMAIKNKPKNKHTVDEYADKLDASRMTWAWKPAGQWHSVHGTNQSTTGGKWQLDTMATTHESYKVRITDSGVVLHTWEYSAIDHDQIVADIQQWAATQ